MASGWRQEGVRMRQDGRQDAVRMMGSLAFVTFHFSEQQIDMIARCRPFGEKTCFCGMAP